MKSRLVSIYKLLQNIKSKYSCITHCYWHYSVKVWRHTSVLKNCFIFNSFSWNTELIVKSASRTLHRAGVIYSKPPIICFPVNRKWHFNILACGKSYIKFFILCYLINPSQTQEAKRLLRSYLVHQKPIWEVATHGWLLEFWDQLLLFLVSQLLLTWRNKNIRRKNEHELSS